MKELLQILWGSRILIAVVTCLFVVIAGIGGILAAKNYKASVLLSLAAEDSGSLAGLGSLVSQLGPLASIAGISASGGGQKSEAVAVLQSRTLTEKYIQENDLLPVLFADLWDTQTASWRREAAEDAPTLWAGNERFRKIRTILQDSKTGLITLSISWNDPAMAAKWANGLIEMTNRYLRDKAIRESERNIAYLNDQISKTELVQVRAAIYGLIENELKKTMLARGRDDYALRVIDPAVAPESPSSPRLLVWLIGGLIAGAIVSLFAVFMRAAWRVQQ